MHVKVVSTSQYCALESRPCDWWGKRGICVTVATSDTWGRQGVALCRVVLFWCKSKSGGIWVEVEVESSGDVQACELSCPAVSWAKHSIRDSNPVLPSQPWAMTDEPRDHVGLDRGTDLLICGVGPF